MKKGYKKTVCPDGKYFHQNKLFFIFTLIIFSEHSYFLRKSQITPEWKQRKKYFLTPFALHWNIQAARKAFIYGLFRNFVHYSNSFADCVSWHAKAVIRGLYFERAFCFCVFRTAYEEINSKITPFYSLLFCCSSLA